MNHFKSPQEVFVVTGDALGQSDDNVAVPYAPSYYEAPQTPVAMEFPTLQLHATPEDEGYGLDLGAFGSSADQHEFTASATQQSWAEPSYSQSDSYATEAQSFGGARVEEGPEYLGDTGIDYAFVGAPTPEQAMNDFRTWLAQNPDSTPANQDHRERLADLYDTLDQKGHVTAAAAAIQAARQARADLRDAAIDITRTDVDPTRTSIMKVADVLGGIAARQLANEDSQASVQPAAASTAEQPAARPTPRGGRHRRNGGRHARH